MPTRRVKDILRLLDRTPLPADLILQASETFGTLDDPDDGFSNVRRVREKMQQLAAGDTFWKDIEYRTSSLTDSTNLGWTIPFVID